MKLIGESNCLTFQLESNMEEQAFFKKFGETGWLVQEAMVVRSVPDMNPEWEIPKWGTFFNCDLKSVQFIVVFLHSGPAKSMVELITGIPIEQWEKNNAILDKLVKNDQS